MPSNEYIECTNKVILSIMLLEIYNLVSVKVEIMMDRMMLVLWLYMTYLHRGTVFVNKLATFDRTCIV